MAKVTASREEVEHFARVQNGVGDMYSFPMLKVRATDGIERSGKAISFTVSTPQLGEFSGFLTLATGAENVEIDYLDIETIERVSTN